MPGDGRDVDDAAAPVLTHRRKHELAKAGKAEDVDFKLIAGIVDGNILHGSEIAVTGIVHKHVDAAFRIEYALHGCHAGSVVGNIYI